MTDTQADLTERARALQHDEHGETPLRKRIGEIMMDGDLPEWAAEQLDELAREQEAALQSEREAAAAEALHDAADELEGFAEHQGSAFEKGAVINCAKMLRRLASPPAPQEETRNDPELHELHDVWRKGSR